jgi:hypothetical protein
MLLMPFFSTRCLQMLIISGLGEVLSVEWCSFCFHEVGVAVVAVVTLVSGGVFAAFDYVFGFLFKVESASRVLTNNINFASCSGHSGSLNEVMLRLDIRLSYFRTLPTIVSIVYKRHNNGKAIFQCKK